MCLPLVESSSLEASWMTQMFVGFGSRCCCAPGAPSSFFRPSSRNVHRLNFFVVVVVFFLIKKKISNMVSRRRWVRIGRWWQRRCNFDKWMLFGAKDLKLDSTNRLRKTFLCLVRQEQMQACPETRWSTVVFSSAVPFLGTQCSWEYHGIFLFSILLAKTKHRTRGWISWILVVPVFSSPDITHLSWLKNSYANYDK